MDNPLFFILLTLVSASIGTMTGFGTSTIMVPVLSLFLPIPATLLFVGILHWFGDIWKMVFFKTGFHLKLILLFGVPGIIASFFAAKLPLTLPEAMLGRFLGLFLVVYVAFLFFKPNWKVNASNPSALLGGTLSGFFSGIFGVGGAIRSTFLTTFDLEKSVFLFTSGVIGLLIDSARLVQYFRSGIQLGSLVITLILCIPVSLMGAYLAKRLVDKIPQKSFRLFIAAALFLVGLRYLFA
ncbi:sulfite exporter TauE/SafE family protein [Candidatus Gottesmanbacteria bacterium]|nr:sulfite exporter TauE/SafE family protein [Candidatus Gottesmanbacteria bacterium]